MCVYVCVYVYSVCKMTKDVYVKQITLTFS